MRELNIWIQLFYLLPRLPSCHRTSLKWKMFKRIARTSWRKQTIFLIVTSVIWWKWIKHSRSLEIIFLFTFSSSVNISRMKSDEFSPDFFFHLLYTLLGKLALPRETERWRRIILGESELYEETWRRHWPAFDCDKCHFSKENKLDFLIPELLLLLPFNFSACLFMGRWCELTLKPSTVNSRVGYNVNEMWM